MQENMQAVHHGGFVRHSPFARIIALITRDTNVVLVSAILNNLLRAVSSVLLTRLLMPEAFGIAGIIGSISFTAAMLSDLGFQAFVVRHEDGDDPRFLDTVWTVSLIRATILSGVLVALSEPIAAIFAKPDLVPMIEWSALLFIVEGLASLTLLTAVRQRMILRLSALELASMLVQIVASVLLAWWLRNVWAVLIALFFSSAAKVVLSYAAFPNSRRRFALDPDCLRDLWGFARYVTGSSMITLLLMQCDKLVLARLMSLQDFGLYILAGNLAAAPMAFATSYTSRVLYPYYSQLWREGTGDLRALFYAKKWLPSLLYSFAAGGLIGSAPLVIDILYDDRYAVTATYLQLLAITPLVALSSYSANEALVAAGRISTTFRANIVKLLWLAVAVPSAYFAEGAVGLVAAVGLMEVPSMLFKWVQLYRIGMLDLRREMLFLGAGLGGFGVGVAGTMLLSPLLR